MLAAFLGNPGGTYANNRHNAGRLLAEFLPFYGELSWRKKFRGLYSALDLGGSQGRAHFIMPETFMNLSGESVAAAANFFGVAPGSVIVVHDELELGLGFVSLKFSGGLGGHNGLRSIKACLSTADFWRLRVGIGRPDGRKPGEGGPPGSGAGIIDWVLSDFGAEERPALAEVLRAGAEVLSRVLFEGPAGLLPEWKKKFTLAGGVPGPGGSGALSPERG